MATTTDSLEQKLARVVEDVLREHLAQCEAAAVRLRLACLSGSWRVIWTLRLCVFA